MIALAALITLPESSLAQSKKDRSPIPSDYEHVVVAGSADAATTVVFFWSAVSEESLRAFRERIAPVLRDRPRGLRVVLSQLLDSKSHDIIGPGALLLCSADYRSYAKNVLQYLATAKNVADVKRRTSGSKVVVYTNSAIEALHRAKQIDLAACEQSGPFYVRQMRGVAKAKQFYVKYGPQELPQYIVNDARLSATDPSVAQILQPARKE